MDDQTVLDYDPWGCGKGDDPYRVLRNVMVVARKEHPCAICFGSIAPGERHRAQTEVNLDGSRQVKTFRFCAECCAAMPRWDDFSNATLDAITERHDLGAGRARRQESNR